MKKKIEILEPCNQDWNKMTNLDKNKFCQKCQKEVIDFRTYEKNEILKILNSNTRVCGHLNSNQLKEKYLTRRNNYKLPRLTFLISLGTILGINEPVFSNPRDHKIELKENKNWESILQKKINDSITIKGKVLDNENQPIPGAIVHLKGTKIGTQVNYDGEFSISIPESNLNENNILIFSFIGYKTREYKFYKKNKYLNINLDIDETGLLGEVIIVSEQNIFQRVGSFFHNLFSNHKNCN